MFKAIIVKTSHKRLDVVIAIARYRIGCKRFVACSGKTLANLRSWPSDAHCRAAEIALIGKGSAYPFRHSRVPIPLCDRFM